MRPKLGVIVAMVLVSAGCAGAPAPSASAEEPGEGGVLAGVVVDAGIRPIANASIEVNGGAAPGTTTDDDGRFEIAGLHEGGVYFLQASKEGFLSNTVQAMLGQPGQIAVRITLERDAETRPYVEAQAVRGLVECSIGTNHGVGASPCRAGSAVRGILCSGYDPAPPPGICLPPIGNDHSIIVVLVDDMPTFAQSEVVWSPSSSFSQELGVQKHARERGQDTHFNMLDWIEGASPITFSWNRTEIVTEGIGAGFDPLYSVLQTRDAPTIVINQDFEIFTHFFYYFEPPEGWTFFEDGPPPEPSP